MGSLRRYFLLISAATIGIVLVLAAFVFVHLFGQSLERRVHIELTNYVNQIAAEIDFASNGAIRAPAGLSEQRFQIAYSGLYWQIDDPDRKSQLRSRSLWDYVLPLPDDVHDVGTIHRYNLPGPEDSNLLVQERSLVVATPTGARTTRIAVAMDESTIVTARTRFLCDVIPYLLALGGLLFLASIAQLAIGLKPLVSVSDGLDAIRDRTTRRLEGRFPKEIQRLTDAVNDLLASQEAALANARKRSGDLAHGLKTPLTVIKNNAANLVERGETEVGREIAGLVDDMENHIHHELVRSRLAPSPELPQSNAVLGKTVSDIVRTLKKTPASENLAWSVNIAADVSVAIDPHDLRELIGNVLENAVKWADKNVLITGSIEQKRFVLRVEDDGPGLETGKISAMMDRGKRFDEKTPGTGIGLSIVREIADLYSLSITIQNRQTHGLCVIITLPLSEDSHYSGRLSTES